MTNMCVTENLYLRELVLDDVKFEKYMLQGMALIKMIIERNVRGGMEEFFASVNDIIDCSKNKINTLALIGASNSGKATLANVLTKYLFVARF